MDLKQEIINLIDDNPCLDCKKPRCMEGCPIHQEIPTFIKQAKNNYFEDAYQTILNNSVLPSICGILCPHEKQCMGNCIKAIKGKPVHIGEIEQKIALLYHNEIRKISNKLSKYQIAIIGGGVAGISAALKLASHGAKVTIFEKEAFIGGAIKKSIPLFRFNDQIIDNLVENLVKLDVKINLNIEFGKNILLDDLKKFDYLLFGFGTMIPKTAFKDNYPNVYQGIDLLNTYKMSNQFPMGLSNGKKALVIGAGNVAMDVSRVLARSGYDTTIVYRRTLALSPALKSEIADAKADNVNFLELHNPVEPIYQDNQLFALKVEVMKLSNELDKSGRPKFISTNIFKEIKTDIIVQAIGSDPDYSEMHKLNFPIFENGWIKPLNNTNYAKYQNIYFIGDFVNGATTIVNAMKSGLNAAIDIIKETEEP